MSRTYTTSKPKRSSLLAANLPGPRRARDRAEKPAREQEQRAQREHRADPGRAGQQHRPQLRGALLLVPARDVHQVGSRGVQNDHAGDDHHPQVVGPVLSRLALNDGVVR